MAIILPDREDGMLSPDEIRQLLRECVTVVKPGETLIVRVPVTWTPDQVSNYQKNFNDWAGYLDLPFRVIVVIGEQLGIAEGAASDPADCG